MVHKREVCHTQLDIVGGLVSMLNIIDDVNGEIYNLGTDEEMSVKDAGNWNS